MAPGRWSCAKSSSSRTSTNWAPRSSSCLTSAAEKTCAGMVLNVPGPRPAGSAGSHPVVLREVLDLGEPQRLHYRRHVHPEAAAQALLEPVPAADRILRRAGPGFDRPLGGRLLFIGAAKRHPVTVLLQHPEQVVQAAQLVADLGLPHLDDERRRLERLIPEGLEFRCPRWRTENPRRLTRTRALAAG